MKFTQLSAGKLIREIVIRSTNERRCFSVVSAFNHNQNLITSQQLHSNFLKENFGSLCRRMIPKNDGIFASNFHTSASYTAKSEKEKQEMREKETALALRTSLFENVDVKNKNTFHEAIKIFIDRGSARRGHVEFIYAASNYLNEFGVARDLETYKKLLDVFPKGKFVAQNTWQVEFMHYPKQQQCAVDLLDEMEFNGVIPDTDMQDIIMATFGKWSFPMRKYMRMLYWMPKFKNMSPWPLPDPIPIDPFELAKIAVARISSVDLESQISIFQTEELADSLDHTWIVSAQSPTQKELVRKLPDNVPVYLEGSYQICLKYHMVSYFVLRAQQKPPPKRMTKDEVDDVSNISLHMFNMEPEESEIVVMPSVHEQEDGVILSVCATGTSSRDSVLSWIRFLQNENPRLNEIPILFTLRAPPPGTVTITTTEKGEERIEDGQQQKTWKTPVNQLVFDYER